MERIQIFAFVACLIVGFFVFELVRKKKLMERYSLMWIFSGIILVVLTLWRDFLELLAMMLGVYYAPTALFIVVAFCGFGLLMHFSIVISKLTEQNKILAQELSLLRYENEMKNSSN
jgi:hypothetical protein